MPSPRRKAVAWRSGLEDRTAEDLTKRGVPFRYEEVKVSYKRPATDHKYTPDFVLDNGIVIETKGQFTVEDRKKHVLVKEQHPALDIRFVFSRASSPIRKGSKTTYADWCRKEGFLFADKVIPQAWLDEPPAQSRIDAINQASA